MVGVLLAGCAPSTPDGSGESTLVVALRGSIDSWNPYTHDQVSAADVLDLLYPRLVREVSTESGGGFEPWLAHRWEASPDRRSLEFHLRTDARWSDGSPVTCRDVEFTWRAQTDEALAWPGAFVKERIEAVECPDEHRAVFRFSESYADQMLDANDDAIVPARYGEVPFERWASTAWEERSSTCGPYRIEVVRPGREAVLVRDPLWWGSPRPEIDRVILREYAEAGSASAALLAGDVDLVERVPPERADALVGSGGPRLVSVPSLAYTYIAWNVLQPGAYAADRAARGCDTACRESVSELRRLREERPHPILADVRVRRALTLAIDRRDLIDGLWGGRARVGSTPIVSALWAHRSEGGLPFDPSRAADLLEEAGWSRPDAGGVRRSTDGRPLSLRVVVSAGNRLRRDALDRVAANLAAVGVELVPEPLSRSELVVRVRDKDFDGLIAGWRAGTRIEPQAILHSEAAVDRGNNFGSWWTAESDALMLRATRAPRSEAGSLWARWQELFHREQPYTVLYEERTLVGVGPRLSGATPSALTPYAGLESWSLRGGDRR